MTDWEIFLECVPWFLKADARVQVAGQNVVGRLPPSVAEILPTFAELLGRASLTPLSVEQRDYQLLAWTDTEGRRIGWLCEPPVQGNPTGLCPDHEQLIRFFGGIAERFNEPDDTWLLNHNEVLTAGEASYDAGFLDDYLWAFEDEGLSLPIQTADYYSVAREANGNTTLCHRASGEVVLFAPDHSFDFVSPLEGCPDYTLYRLKGAVSFRDWVEVVAGQWLAHLDC